MLSIEKNDALAVGSVGATAGAANVVYQNKTAIKNKILTPVAKHLGLTKDTVEVSNKAAKGGAKATAKSGAKEAAKGGAKAAAKSGAKTAAKNGAKAAAKGGAKTAAKNGAKAAAKSGAKTAAKNGAKAATKSGAKNAVKATKKAAKGIINTVKDATLKAGHKVASMSRKAADATKKNTVKFIEKTSFTKAAKVAGVAAAVAAVALVAKKVFDKIDETL